MSSESESAGGSTPVRFFARIALPLFVLYLITANWTTPYNIDALTNVLTAAELARDGDVLLDEHEVLARPEFRGAAAWVVTAGDSAAAQYPPGAALVASPLYVIWPGEGSAGPYIAATGEVAQLPIPPLFPAALVSSAVTAIAVGLLGLSFRKLGGERVAMTGAYVAGLATGAWSVSADSLWQHGPASMWIAAGLLLSAGHRIWSGVTFGAAVLTRPHTALVAAGNGVGQAWHQRSVRPLVSIGFGSAAGLAGLILYNRAVFGVASISGGYGSAVGGKVTSLDPLAYLGNIGSALFDPTRGLLVYSPFLLILVPGLRSAWRAAPSWVRGSAIGGLAYVLLQLKANRFSGGEGFWAYRYPLEMLTACAPLLFLSYTEWVKTHPAAIVRRLFFYLVVVSLTLTFIGAVYFSSFWAGPTG